MLGMRRRKFIALLGGAAAWPLAASAQQSRKIPRIGVLWHAGNAEQEGSNFTELVKGFIDLGYIDGRNIILEHRFPNELPDRFKTMAAELVDSRVDVLISVGANAAPYAKDATTTIPVVLVAVCDPIGSGLVKSIARPEANVTGISNSAADLIGKRVELLKEMISGLSRIALLVNSGAKIAPIYVASAEAAAARLNLSHRTFQWSSPEELDPAFAAMKLANIEALMTVPDGLAFTHRDTIAHLAIGQRIPLSVFSRETFKVGALMAYGADANAIYRRAAVYVDKILHGRKPGELPVEGPTKFELLINLKTAKAMGLAVPPTLLTRADEVIE
jgi:putative ABC transport system substrate-binding protein